MASFNLQTILERIWSHLEGSTVPKASLDGLNAELGTRNSELATALADLLTAKTSLKTLGESLSARDAELQTSQTNLATLTTANAAVILERDAFAARLADPKGELATSLAATLASHGVPAAAVPDLTKSGGTMDRATAQKEYDRLFNDGKAMEAGQFYQTHKALLS